jgi:hypothetical protein
LYNSHTQFLFSFLSVFFIHFFPFPFPFPFPFLFFYSLFFYFLSLHSSAQIVLDNIFSKYFLLFYPYFPSSFSIADLSDSKEELSILRESLSASSTAKNDLQYLCAEHSRYCTQYYSSLLCSVLFFSLHFFFLKICSHSFSPLLFLSFSTLQLSQLILSSPYLHCPLPLFFLFSFFSSLFPPTLSLLLPFFSLPSHITSQTI